ncbi:pirin family protein [Pseudooceanicola sediminis]|uniref:Pirin family protein n=1 Tax=Pseudooceanicola sediminis TaxID=2211117 RepID=A0A399J4N6_9RHOB|nr:pirin family protein [Pseudooceanicola sediminis]KAA2315545.1 pirin family protein [Puniceibacterium sp. HSS470]RII40251.1 pirin family protein [Pseudooceanicola sediminis]|tara:strand:- start:42605 stop:43597 length:993 start_codon:yes stop_codon:yes gene_type:complete
MSWNPAVDLTDPEAIARDAIESVIVPRARDIGGFEVRRALPAPRRQMVGPFIFFDQMGPAELVTGQGIDVRPHPHIGLGTVTYLYKGTFHHQDSIGSDQLIKPGEVNWMVAGKGVSHSERSPSAEREGPQSLYGIQTWIALPEDHEERAPMFEHFGQPDLPMFEAEGITARLILGSAFGRTAPVTLFSEAFYLDVTLRPGRAFPLPDDHEDRGIHVTHGEITVAGEVFRAGQMMVFRPGDRISVRAGAEGARFMALGGATLNGPRYIWWNFVASSEEKIEAAKIAWRMADWGKGVFDLPPQDRAEFIPAPDDGPGNLTPMRAGTRVPGRG